MRRKIRLQDRLTAEERMRQDKVVGKCDELGFLDLTSPAEALLDGLAVLPPIRGRREFDQMLLEFDCSFELVLCCRHMRTP